MQIPPLAAIRKQCVADRLSIPRRQFVQCGALGGLLTLPELLRAGNIARQERSCIFIVQQGGPSHIDTWDMKPDAPLEIRGALRSIPTTVPGTQVCELLPRLAARADKYCILRTLCHTSNDHDAGMHMFLTGRSAPAADAPYLGSIASRLQPATRNFPSYVWIQELEFQGSASARYSSGGHLGPAHAPFLIGRGTENFANPAFQVSALDPPEGVSNERLLARRRLLDSVSPTTGKTTSLAIADTHENFQERAFDLVAGPAARQAFDLSRERVEVRDRYGRHPLGQNLLAARRLIEAGARLVSVNAFTGFEPNTKWPPVVNVWDMHGAPNRPEVGIFSENTYGLPWCLPRLDDAVSALLDDLDQRGLLDTTLVVLAGEFGRTPRVNAQFGRDHYCQCFSAVVAGAGIRGGAVFGRSDKNAAFPADWPVSLEDFSATLLAAMGIAPGTPLDSTDFTRRAGSGEPIRELFG
ncbi:MAG: DUF1501 domain-containing protein [Planctomycetia bacterium]|nr:DUF1501 domain-containing protein [Planctomycetia bacterium]